MATEPGVGTNGIKPGAGEWYTSRDAARELVKGDWEGWGDLHLEMESASIQTHGEVGWIAVPAKSKWCQWPIRQSKC